MIKRVIAKIKRTKPVMKIRYRLSSENFEMDADEAMKKLQKIAPMPKSTAITQNEILPAKYDLTIIVPAYNSEKWIRQCVDSIIFQETSYSFVAVIIDDGSTDDTGKILDSYLPNDRLKVVHQENKGYSGARNAALKRIESTYIMFVDSDDCLLPNAIECLMSTALINHADIVEGNGYTFDEKGRIARIKSIGDGRYLWGGPCLKVIKSSLFARIRFPEGYLYEDTIINYLIENLSQRTFFLDDEIYAYRIHSDSITQKHTADLNRVDSFWIMLHMLDCMKKLNIKLTIDNYQLTLMHIVHTYRRGKLLPDEIKRYVFIVTKAFLVKYYSSFFCMTSQYRLLEKSILNNNYRGYVFICENNYTR